MSETASWREITDTLVNVLANNAPTPELAKFWRAQMTPGELLECLKLAAEGIPLSDMVDELERRHQLDLVQMEVNKQEAAHQHTFVAGWRPAVG